MSNGQLEIKAISGHRGGTPGAGNTISEWQEAHRANPRL